MFKAKWLVFKYFKQLLWVICITFRVESAWWFSQTIQVKITRTTRFNYNNCVSFLAAKIKESASSTTSSLYWQQRSCSARTQQNQVHKWRNGSWRRRWPHRCGVHHLSRVVALQTPGPFSEASRQVENSQLCLFPNVSEGFLQQYRCAAAAPGIKCQYGGRYLHTSTCNIKEWRKNSCFLLNLIPVGPDWNPDEFHRMLKLNSTLLLSF